MTQPTLSPPSHPSTTRGVPDGVLTTVRRKERLVAGVCSGIGVRYNVDPLLVRVGFALLGLSMGVGFVLYLFCWLWMVEDGSQEPLVHQQVPSSRNWAWPGVVIGLVGASILTMILLGNLFPFGPAPALILLGVWFWARRVRRASAPPPQPLYLPAQQNRPMTSFDAASMAWQSRLESVYLSDEPLPAVPPQPLAVFDLYADRPVPAAMPVRTPATSRRSWWATLVMVVVAGAAFSLVAVLAPSQDYRWLLPSAAALAVIGVFLLVGAFGRRPHLAILSGLVVGATMLASLLGPSLTPVGPDGLQSYSVASEVPAAVDLRFRTTTLDLSAVALTEDRTISVNAFASSVTIEPPAGYLVEYDLQGGSLVVNGDEHAAGVVQGTIDERLPNTPTLTIKVRATAAEVTLP